MSAVIDGSVTVNAPLGNGDASVTLPRAGGADAALSTFGVKLTRGELGSFEEALDFFANSNCAPPCFEDGFGALVK